MIVRIHPYCIEIAIEARRLPRVLGAGAPNKHRPLADGRSDGYPNAMLARS